jgi:hypothetical protein
MADAAKMRMGKPKNEQQIGSPAVRILIKFAVQY